MLLTRLAAREPPDSRAALVRMALVTPVPVVRAEEVEVVEEEAAAQVGEAVQDQALVAAGVRAAEPAQVEVVEPEPAASRSSRN